MKQYAIITRLLVCVVIEIALYGLYLHYQPQCAPCPLGVSCPPCVSKEQNIIVVFMEVIPILVVVEYWVRRMMRR